MFSNKPIIITTIGAISLAIAMGVGRFAFTPLLPMMQAEQLLTLSQGSWLAAANYLGYLVGALSALILPISRVTVIRASLLILSLVTYAMSQSLSFELWLCWRFIAGLCSAWLMVFVSSWCLGHLARMQCNHYIGWIYGGVGFGITTVGLQTLWLMLHHYSALASWNIIGIGTLILSLLLCIGFRPDPDYTKNGTTNREEFQWTRQRMRLFLCYTACGFGYIIPATYLPMQAKAIISDPAIFGWVWPVFGVTAMLSTIIASKVNRYYSDQTLWSFSHLMMAIGVIISLAFSGILPIIISAFLVGGFFMIAVMYAMRVGQLDSKLFLVAMVTAFSLGQLLGPIAVSLFLYIDLGLPTLSLLSSALLLLSAFYLTKPINTTQAKSD